MKLVNLIKKFAKETDGVTAIEYAVIGVAVAGTLAAIFGGGDFDTMFKDAFNTIGKSVKGTS